MTELSSDLLLSLSMQNSHWDQQEPAGAPQLSQGFLRLNLGSSNINKLWQLDAKKSLCGVFAHV